MSGIAIDPDRNVWLLIEAGEVVSLFASQAAALVAMQDLGEVA